MNTSCQSRRRRANALHARVAKLALCSYGTIASCPRATTVLPQGCHTVMSLDAMLTVTATSRGVVVRDLADVQQLLDSAGFERKTINYRRSDDKRTTRSYYTIAAGSVGVLL